VEVASAVANKNGCTQPRYNLVFIDACQSVAKDNGGCGLCYEIQDEGCDMQQAFGGPAYLGWRTDCLDTQMHKDWSVRIFHYLRGGSTLYQAVSFSCQEYWPNACVLVDHGAQPGFCGDGTITLTTVWGGQPGQWYRPTDNEGST
jgi:hypothetical protein